MYYDERSAERVSAALEALPEDEIWLPDTVNVQFFFSAHGSAEDIGDYERVRSLMQASDVLLKEQVTWVDDSPEEKDFNKTARGDQKAYDRMRLFDMNMGDTYSPVLLRALFATDTVVTSVDLGRRNPITPHVHKLMHIEDGKSPEAFVPISHDPDESAEHSLKIVNDFAVGQAYREKHMISQLGPRLERIIAAYPKLARKGEVNVLFEMGSMHTGMFYKLRKLFGDSRVGRFFTEQPVWCEDKQILRTKLMGIELPFDVERELILRGYMTSTAIALGDENGLLEGLSTYKQYALGRAVSREYGIEELEEFVVLNAKEEPDKVEALYKELIDKVVLAKEEQLR